MVMNMTPTRGISSGILAPAAIPTTLISLFSCISHTRGIAQEINKVEAWRRSSPAMIYGTISAYAKNGPGIACRKPFRRNHNILLLTRKLFCSRSSLLLFRFFSYVRFGNVSRMWVCVFFCVIYNVNKSFKASASSISARVGFLEAL